MRSLQTEATIDPTGQDLLTAVQDGDLPPPPIAMLLNLALDAVGEGRTTFSLPSEPAFDNGQGAIHGGVLATIADFAVSTAVMTVVPARHVS